MGLLLLLFWFYVGDYTWWCWWVDLIWFDCLLYFCRLLPSVVVFDLLVGCYAICVRLVLYNSGDLRLRSFSLCCGYCGGKRVVLLLVVNGLRAAVWCLC